MAVFGLDDDGRSEQLRAKTAHDSPGCVDSCLRSEDEIYTNWVAGHVVCRQAVVRGLGQGLKPQAFQQCLAEPGEFEGVNPFEGAPVDDFLPVATLGDAEVDQFLDHHRADVIEQ